MQINLKVRRMNTDYAMLCFSHISSISEAERVEGSCPLYLLSRTKTQRLYSLPSSCHHSLDSSPLLISNLQHPVPDPLLGRMSVLLSMIRAVLNSFITIYNTSLDAVSLEV